MSLAAISDGYAQQVIHSAGLKAAPQYPVRFICGPAPHRTASVPRRPGNDHTFPDDTPWHARDSVETPTSLGTGEQHRRDIWTQG